LRRSSLKYKKEIASGQKGLATPSLLHSYSIGYWRLLQKIELRAGKAYILTVLYGVYSHTFSQKNQYSTNNDWEVVNAAFIS